MHADLTALNASFWTAEQALTDLTQPTSAPEAPVEAPEAPKVAAVVSPETYYAAKRRQEVEGAATTERLRLVRLERKVARLVAEGWTTEAALNHLEGACDQMLCTGTHA